LRPKATTGAGFEDRFHFIMVKIKFGTSGWRAIIADEFTFDNVELVTAAVAQYVQQHNRQSKLIVGYDTRFQADRFAWQCAEWLSAKGIQVLYCQSPAPTPAIAYEIRRRQTSGGVNFTASHNPGEYCGFKFSTADGAPALPEITQQIERNIEQLRQQKLCPDQAAPRLELIEKINPAAEYLKMLSSKIDLPVIRQAGLKMTYDPLYGTGRSYLDSILLNADIPVRTIHNHRDVLFGGHPPEPSEEVLAELKSDLARDGSKLGLSTDGDADRFGILDQNGDFITPNQIIALLLDYLIETRGWSEGAARSVATSHFLDAVARFHGRKLYETPVGFKYIGELIQDDKIVIGGEESAGLTIKGHVPEKDGILACLLVAEMVARRSKSLNQQLDDLQRKVGFFVTRRLNWHLSPELKEKVKARLEDPPSQLAGQPIAQLNRTDGLKMIFDDQTWILLRLSGTEPVARCYVEAHNPEDLERLVGVAQQFVFQE
jgi:phosphoglucomutase